MNSDLPWLLRRILLVTLPREKAEFVFGDLAEEYGERAAHSQKAADLWLRRQVLGSVPRFLWERAERSGLVQLGALVGVTLVACVAILLWESQVAREVAALAADRVAGAPLGAVRTLYVLVQAVAFAAAGAALARWTFHRGQGFTRNALLRLTPLVVLIFAPAFAARLSGDVGYSLQFLVPWALTLTAALVGGARFAHRKGDSHL